MIFKKIILCCFLLYTFLSINASAANQDPFTDFLQPLFKKNCYECHGGKKTKGKVDLVKINSINDLLGHPKMVKDMMEAIDAYDMPPEDEPELDETVRLKLLSTLKGVLREASGQSLIKTLPLRRLNRFQYNNIVKDLFKLNIDIFHLPEIFITRGNYSPTQNKMPDTVNIHSHVRHLERQKNGTMQGVIPYPKDLRALHGYDNQADHMSLSPLMLDNYIQLSISIINSDDFNVDQVGIWTSFFEEPTSGWNKTNLEERIKPFLENAFRGHLDDKTTQRYLGFTLHHLNNGMGYTDAMKKLASATLCSPRFFYLHNTQNKALHQIQLAERLSLFLWGSAPDQELLKLASEKKLSDPNFLNKSIERMMKDPKIVRFLDSFPAQWLQLEGVLASSPDHRLQRGFSLNPNYPASITLLKEPLLLFDAAFMENLSISDLISPKFSYRSDFLNKWYTKTDAPTPTEKDREVYFQSRVKERNIKRVQLQKEIDAAITEFKQPYTENYKNLLKKKQASLKTMDVTAIKPIARWEFNKDLKDSIGQLHLHAQGKVEHLQGGKVKLNNSWLKSVPLTKNIKAKTFEVWFKLNESFEQRTGGVMTMAHTKGQFDSIVYGERLAQHWMPGSDGHARSADFLGGHPETHVNDMIHLIMTYAEDGTITLYKNGKIYGDSIKKNPLIEYTTESSHILFGARHLPNSAGKYLKMTLDKAQLYDRALSPEEVALLCKTEPSVPFHEVITELNKEEKVKRINLQQLFRKKALVLNKNPIYIRKFLKADFQKKLDNEYKASMMHSNFKRTPLQDQRFGGIITNAAIMSMTSNPTRTRPIGRGAWMIEVIFNDPPPPPPNDIPPLQEDNLKDATIKERFAQHRENPDCAGCHNRLDPLGFALENFDIVGQWREQYKNRRKIDPSGTMLKHYSYKNVLEFKQSLIKEDHRIAKAFITHLMRFALARELNPGDSLIAEEIVDRLEKQNGFKIRDMIREVILSKSFIQTPNKKI